MSDLCSRIRDEEREKGEPCADACSEALRRAQGLLKLQDVLGEYGIGTPPSDDGYDSLRAIYAMALEQAQGGKGKERHANGQPFDQQPICQGGRRFGAGCLIYQAWKKSHETPVLLQMDNGRERAIRELLGVINYAAAAILVIKEGS